MPRRKNGQNNLSKHFSRRSSLEDLPLKTMKVTVYALRWIFLLIFLYMTASIAILTIQGGTGLVVDIVGWSITGFFTFFMGYFGWILAQGLIEMIAGDKEKLEDNLSYYLRKNKKYKF